MSLDLQFGNLQVTIAFMIQYRVTVFIIVLDCKSEIRYYF